MVWHSLTSDNLGVIALTESHIQIIRAAAEKHDIQVQFTIFGTTGQKNLQNLYTDVDTTVGISLKHILFNLIDFIKSMNKCDLILDIGEGDSFTDIYGTKRLINLITTKLLAATLNKPLILAPQTLGPFKTTIGQWLFGFTLQKALKVYVRDKLSADYVKQANSCITPSLVTDVAFRLPYNRQKTLEPNNKIRFGLNVSGLLFNGGYSGQNQFGLTIDYKKLILSLLEILNKRENIEIHLIGHVLSEANPVEDDFAAAQLIAKDFPNVILAPRFASPSEAKSYIAQMDFFTGARMHACIGAFSAGIPVIPMAYSRKFIGLFSSLGFDQVIDLANVKIENAIQSVIYGFDNRNALKELSLNGTQKALALLNEYEYFLAEKLHYYHEAKPH